MKRCWLCRRGSNNPSELFVSSKKLFRVARRHTSTAVSSSFGDFPGTSPHHMEFSSSSTSRLSLSTCRPMLSPPPSGFYLSPAATRNMPLPKNYALLIHQHTRERSAAETLDRNISTSPSYSCRYARSLALSRSDMQLHLLRRTSPGCCRMLPLSAT